MKFRRMRTTATDLLLAAATLLERDGWVRGEYERRGRHCLYGAINAVPADSRARAAAVAYLMDRGYNFYWNDRRARSKRQVIKVLRDAAKALRTPRR